jgi:hypothetical protein
MKQFLSVIALSQLASVADAFMARQTPLATTVRPSFAVHRAVAALEAPPLSPKTIWGEKVSDIRRLQDEMRKQDLPEFSVTVSAKGLGMASSDTAVQLAYVKANAMELKQKMQDHGAVIFRDFDLMKTQEGFQQFYTALGMKVCLDPLHSVSARPTVDGQKNSPVYEAVNKESRKNFFIGTNSWLLALIALKKKVSLSHYALLRNAQRVCRHSRAPGCRFRLLQGS